MTSLIKLLKPQFLAAYLEHAAAMLGQDIFLAVADLSGVVAAAGSVPAGFNPNNGVSQAVVVRELFFDAQVLGRLAVGYVQPHGDGGMEQLSKTAAFLHIDPGCPHVA